MSYLVEQKVRGQIYVYESTGYWDKEKKQSRQKRVYLGRKDPQTGKIVKTKYSPRSVDIKSVKETGPTHVAKEVMAQVGLKGCIDTVFGKDSIPIQSLLHYMLLESGPYYLQHPWAERTGEHALSSQVISQLLSEIGTNSGVQDDFFREWNRLLGHQKAAYMDITSISSYSNNIDFLEWGYNRDKESLEQMNVGVLIGQTCGLPMMYRIYPGSTADVSTLKKTLYIGREQYGLETDRLVMDRGFYSQYNLKEMINGRHTFVIPLPFSVKAAKQLLSQTKTVIHSPMEAFSHEGDPYFYVKERVELNDMSLVAHVYLNERKRAKDMSIFMRRLSDLESALDEQTFF